MLLGKTLKNYFVPDFPQAKILSEPFSDNLVITPDKAGQAGILIRKFCTEHGLLVADKIM